MSKNQVDKKVEETPPVEGGQRVEVKVLYQCHLGKPGDCVEVDASDLPGLKVQGYVDDNEAEVAALKAK